MQRNEMLEIVDTIINKDREQQYGSPENNFSLIANYWSLYLKNILKRDLTNVEIGVMMALLKIARIQSGATKADNFIDLAGYAICAGELATEKGE